RAAVDALYHAFESSATATPSDIAEPGGGYGFTLLDPERRRIRIVAGTGEHSDVLPRTDVPVKLSHVVFLSRDPEAMSAFYRGLGFRWRDETGRNFFLGCNEEHHCLAFGRGSSAALSHVAFDLPSIDALMRGVGRLKKAGMVLEHGVGRHGPGDNVFAYFMDR